jgi:hypothetical protein
MRHHVAQSHVDLLRRNSGLLAAAGVARIQADANFGLARIQLRLAAGES